MREQEQAVAFMPSHCTTSKKWLCWDEIVIDNVVDVDDNYGK